MKREVESKERSERESTKEAKRRRGIEAEDKGIKREVKREVVVKRKGERHRESRRLRQIY